MLDDGAISYSNLAHTSGVDETLVRRFVQHAIINRFFQEKTPGFVSHSAASLLLKQSEGMQDTVGFLLDDIAPGSVHVLEAMQKWPQSSEPTETGFNIAEQTSDSFYQRLARESERSRRFGGGMRFMTQGSLYDIKHLINGYDWNALDFPGARVVDVGGGHGGVSQALARATKHVKFVVQDLEGTVAEGAKLLPSELKGRVEFVSHDFFTEQPTKHAEVYFFRFILHNWADKYAARILESLIPAMKHGSRVIIYEFLPDEVANTSWTQKQKRQVTCQVLTPPQANILTPCVKIRNLDMIQATGWNSLERTASDWRKLFATVGQGYKFLSTRTPKGSAVSLIEARFEKSQVREGEEVASYQERQETYAKLGNSSAVAAT